MPQNTVLWETPGIILDVNASGQVVSGANPVKDEKVLVTEIGNSFDFPGSVDARIAGVPIDANLCVYLIKRLYKKLAGLPDDEDTAKWLRDLLVDSRALTIDKNSLLKTISQPGCEGIRFYLGTKLDEADEEKDILTFITVGVDKEGVDLRYEFKQDTADEIAENIFKVESLSLMSEYAIPPQSLTSTAETYVLGTYGWEGNI